MLIVGINAGVSGLFFLGAQLTRLNEASLTATLMGEPMKDGVHRISREIKAVTFHDLKIVRDKDALKAHVVLDV